MFVGNHDGRERWEYFLSTGEGALVTGGGGVDDRITDDRVAGWWKGKVK
jgi:hypothetical protein